MNKNVTRTISTAAMTGALVLTGIGAAQAGPGHGHGHDHGGGGQHGDHQSSRSFGVADRDANGHRDGNKHRGDCDGDRSDRRDRDKDKTKNDESRTPATPAPSAPAPQTTAPVTAPVNSTTSDVDREALIEALRTLDLDELRTILLEVLT